MGSAKRWIDVLLEQRHCWKYNTNRCAFSLHFAPRRERMGVGEGSRFLVFNTEGITDEVNYDLQMKIEGGAGGKFEIVDGNRRQTQL